MLAVNVRATATLLDAARRAGASGVVHAGSSSEYGDRDHAPREDEILDPASHYAVTKAAATHLCRHAARTEGVATTTLRLYSVYGPWEEPARLIPTLLSHALRGELPPLVSPRTVRDFVFVEDACDAFLRAGARTAEHAGAVFNVGSGRQTTLEELVNTTRALFHVEAEPQWGTMEARSWDTAIWVADPRAAQDALGWTATTPLADGLRSTAKWLRQGPARREYT
jgi:dolichol-phosphate mannosyltransferase